MFDSTSGPIFAQLQYILTTIVGGKTYPIAFIQPYKTLPINRRSRTDKDLGLLQLRKETRTEFISVHSIIRGAVAIPTDLFDEAIVWDALDGDMFLRVVKHFPGYTTGFYNV